jgi:hypothetical protein
MSISIDKAGAWRLYWGPGPLPAGAECLGTIERAPGDAGALLLCGARYYQGNAGCLRSLPSREVQRALRRSAGAYSSAAAELGARGGRQSSPAKIASNRANALKRWHPTQGA